MWVTRVRSVTSPCSSSALSFEVRMLSRLRAAAVLDGVRGKPGVNRAQLSQFIARVSEFGAANAEHLAELDLNPVLTGPNDVVAVYWLLVEK